VTKDAPRSLDRAVAAVPVIRALGHLRLLMAPRAELLPALGARLGTRPRAAAFALSLPRRLPGGRMRQAVYRNVSRPLIARMHTTLVVRTAAGSRLRVDTSDAAGRTLAVTGEWEAHVTPLFARRLAPGDVCVDVGANIGYYTLLASRIVGARGHVYALEPAPATYAELRDNLELNGVTNVTAIEVAAGADDGSGALYAGPPGNTGQASMQVPTGTLGASIDERTDVTVRRLASVVADVHRPRLRLVKIDVEGAEFAVLRGLEPLLEAGAEPDILMELHPALWGDLDPGFLEEFCARHELDVTPVFEAGRRVPGRLRAAYAFRVDLLDERQDVLLSRRHAASAGAVSPLGDRRGA
jgi:FkbM family methyltransferase